MKTWLLWTTGIAGLIMAGGCVAPQQRTDFMNCQAANARAGELASRIYGTLSRAARRAGSEWYNPAAFPDAYADMPYAMRVSLDQEVTELAALKRSSCLP